MKSGVTLLLALLFAASPAAAISKNQCYEVSRSFVVSLLHGRFDVLADHELRNPEEWPAWIEDRFPGEGEFQAFSVVEIERTGSGCQARIRIKKTGGSVYVLFADVDQRHRLTDVRTLRDMLEHRKRELEKTTLAITELMPQVRSGNIDDVGLLPLLREFRNTVRDAQEDVDAAVRTVEGQPPP